jgi:hypothetical protein
MSEWRVITTTGEKMVKAWTFATTASGDLVLKDNQGNLVHIFASGHWITCEQVTQATHGYGG